YYLVTQDAVKTVIYAVTSNVGVGLDEGVDSYSDHSRIKTVWMMKDIGFIFMLAATVAAMLTMADFLFSTKAFGALMLKKEESVSFPKNDWRYWVFLVVLIVLPVALFRKGILSANKFLGIPISQIWLLGGTNNSYISWQWMVSIGMLVVFLVYHFLYGRKNGGSLRTYGFKTSDNGSFDAMYVVKAFFFGLFTVGAGYILFSLISAYTKQGMHIATFMLSTINTHRTLCIVMYFLFQIPYFLTSSLAVKSIGLTETEDNPKGMAKSLLAGTAVTVLGLFILWLVFIILVCQFKTLTNADYFMKDRVYIYTIAILPLFIGMTIANTLNIYVSKKTNSIWAGLFTALLWGTWMIISCGGMAKYVY
ncbi:MAG: hypothetical protein ACI4S4_00625, partial [Candidatus Ornithospirochaeta sp.]